MGTIPLSITAARAIPIDKSIAEQAAKVLVAKIRRDEFGILEDLAKSNYNFRITDMAGKEWTIAAVLEIKNYNHKRFKPDANVDGRIKQNSYVKDAKLINLRLNDLNLAFERGLAKASNTGTLYGKERDGLNNAESVIMDKARQEVVFNVLIHELAHAFDPASVSYKQEKKNPYFLPKSFDKATPEEKSKYVSQPVELRAFMVQVVDEVSKIYKSGMTWQELLAGSPTWNTRMVWATPRAKAKVIEAVQRWMTENNS